MLATYHKTIMRNEESGETEFYVCPKETCEYSKDGLLYCRGFISAYLPNAPLSIEGRQDGEVFLVEKAEAAGSTDDLLDYLFSRNLSKTERTQIKKLVEDDLLGFCKRKDAYIRIRSALSSYPDGMIHAKEIYHGTCALIDSGEMFSLFHRLGIPVNIMESLLRSSIGMQRLRDNPYRSLYGIDPCDGDRIAVELKKDIPAYASDRIMGFISYSLDRSLQAGNSSIPLWLLCYIVKNKIKRSGYPDDALTPAVIFKMIHRMPDKLCLRETDDDVHVYWNKVLGEEDSVVKHTARLLNSARNLIVDIDVKKTEEDIGFTYNEGQKSAFRSLRSGGIKIITGPPGSGKTALMKGLIAAYRRAFPDRYPCLLATTGAAAQVLKASTGIPAQTVHKCLGIRPMGQKSFSAKDINDPIRETFIIVDEASMLDLETCAALLCAVQSGSLLLFVGDEDQLQSVGYGNIFHDLIHSGIIHVYRLTEVMRQSGLICENAFRINHGDTSLTAGKGFVIRQFEKEENAIEILQKEIILERSLILSPVKAGMMGTYHVNDIIQKKDGNFCFKYGKISFYEGDRIIMTATDYSVGYYNGDIGTIIEYTDGKLKVSFSEKELMLSRDSFSDIALAYCLTVHKSQGSEKEDVHILLPKEPENMLTRRLLYTAVTRAKENVYIYYVGDALNKAISNVSESRRYSNLEKRLQNEIKEERP